MLLYKCPLPGLGTKIDNEICIMKATLTKMLYNLTHSARREFYYVGIRYYEKSNFPST